jgi:hypothetical protein
MTHSEITTRQHSEEMITALVIRAANRIARRVARENAAEKVKTKHFSHAS